MERGWDCEETGMDKENNDHSAWVHHSGIWDHFGIVCRF